MRQQRRKKVNVSKKERTDISGMKERREFKQSGRWILDMR